MPKGWKSISLILRKDHGNDCNIALSWTPKGRGKRGKPKTTWRRTVEEREQSGWGSWAAVRMMAAHKDELRCLVDALKLCARRHEANR
jgi:type VI protein secretion system component VasK